MTDLEIARARLEDIIRWWGILGDVAESATGVVGHRLSMTGVHGAPKDATVTAILQIDAVDTIQRDVEALAGKMGWRGARKDGDPKLYIHGNLEWAQLNLAPIEWAGTIHDIHRRVGSLTGHAPRATQRLCPICGETLRIIPPPRPRKRWETAREREQAALTPDRFTCDGCQETRTSEELAALVRWRASNVPMATTHEAAKLLGVKPGSIRQRAIDRGLTPRKVDGKSLYKITDLM